MGGIYPEHQQTGQQGSAEHGDKEGGAHEALSLRFCVGFGLEAEAICIDTYWTIARAKRSISGLSRRLPVTMILPRFAMTSTSFRYAVP
jgi:hypothetical protein